MTALSGVLPSAGRTGASPAAGALPPACPVTPLAGASGWGEAPAKRARLDLTPRPAPATPNPVEAAAGGERVAAPPGPAVAELWDALPSETWELILEAAYRQYIPASNPLYDKLGTHSELPLALSSRAPYAAWRAPSSGFQTKRMWMESIRVAGDRDPRSPLEFLHAARSQATLPFVRKLDIGGSRLFSSDMPEVWNQLSQRAKLLRELYFSYSPKLTPDALLGLSMLPNLQRLSLWGVAQHINDQTLAALEHLPSLTFLSISAFCRDNNLDHLKPTCFTARGIESLAVLHQLTALHLDGHPLHVDALAPVLGLTRLKTLSVPHWQGMTRTRLHEITTRLPHLEFFLCSLVIRTKHGLAYDNYRWESSGDGRYVDRRCYLAKMKKRQPFVPDFAELNEVT